MDPIKRALISVSDKRGLIPLARSLVAHGVELISTGGTARHLTEAGLPVKALAEHTGFPEMLDGRVKTLHPKVHGGLLFRRGNAEDVAAVERHQIAPIDLVVVNLYPFAETIARPGADLEEAVENIDIGGPSMLRSGAKNFAFVTVVTDPGDYPQLIQQIESSGGTTLEFRRQLAQKVFARTAEYDGMIASYLLKTFPAMGRSEEKSGPGKSEGTTEVPDPQSIFPPRLTRKALRYGENPHQRGALFGPFDDYFEQLQGKQLSYNNLLDLTAATSLIGEFQGDKPTIAILKHMNPCGVGQGENLAAAWEKAYATDREAPFGGIIAANSAVDEECARRISEIFSEVIVAPSYDQAALDMLRAKKNLRVLESRKSCWSGNFWEIRSVGSELLLVQEKDRKGFLREDGRVVSARQPTEEEWAAMLFGWRVVKHVKSNAIVYAGSDRTLGIGAGQMSRVEAARVAIERAKRAGLSLENSVVCSDAFFPFPDGLALAGQAGASGAIQPGGSIRDADVIAAANTRNMAMVFTGTRHFWH